MNQIREIQRINEEELTRGIAGTNASWHQQYARSAWCFVGNLDHKLVEGDVIAILSEYGEIDDMHLVREEDTGKSKGFAFCKYEDSRSCVLAVDNLCGYNILGRSLRVDHVENYRLPKSLQDKEEELQKRLLEKGGLDGHAYDGVELANDFNLHQGQDLFAKPPANNKREREDPMEREKQRKREEKKEEKRREKEKRKRERAEKRMEREEKRREKRAKKMHQPEEDTEEQRKHHKKRKKESKKESKRGDSNRESNKSGRKDKRKISDSLI